MVVGHYYLTTRKKMKKIYHTGETVPKFHSKIVEQRVNSGKYVAFLISIQLTFLAGGQQP
jgi:hypothetical protein